VNPNTACHHLQERQGTSCFDVSVGSRLCGPPEPNPFGSLSSFASETLMASMFMRVSEANELRPKEGFGWGHVKLATAQHVPTG